MAFAYGSSIELRVEKHLLALEKGRDRHMGDSDEQQRKEHSFPRLLEIGGSDLKLSLFVLEARTTAENDYDMKSTNKKTCFYKGFQSTVDFGLKRTLLWTRGS